MILTHQASLHEEEKTINFLIKHKSTTGEAAPSTPTKHDDSREESDKSE